MAVGTLSSGLYAHDKSSLQGSDGARGEARIGGDNIRVRGDRLPSGVEISILIEDGDGNLVEAFRTVVEGNGSFDVRAEEEDGLPHGATSASDFAGRAVEVVESAEGGATLLSGRFPSAADREERGVGTSPLTPTEAAPDASGRVRTKAEGGRQVLEVRVRGLADMTVFTVCVVNEAGESEEIGTITTSDGGNGTLKIDTAKDASLPFGAGGVGEIAGFAVAVKAEDGTVVLEGTIPALEDEEDEDDEDEDEDEDEEEDEVEFDLTSTGAEPGIRGEVEIEVEREDGELEVEVEVEIEDATRGAEYMIRFCRPESEDEVRFTAEVNADQEVPAPMDVPEGAGGSGSFTFNPATRELSFFIEFGELSSPEVAAHFHVAPPGEAGPVIIPLEPGSPKEGTVEVPEANVEDLLAGNVYVNIHTEVNGPGEIRGQLVAAGRDCDRFALRRADDDGEVEVEKESLPLGASSLQELGGAIVEVLRLDADEMVLVLTGTVPQVDGEPVEPLEFEVNLEQPMEPVIAGAHGTVEFEEQDDEREIEIEVEDLTPNTAFRVELSSPEPDSMTETLFDGMSDGVGDIRRRSVFFGDDALPFGAMSFREYDGFTISVVNADGATVLSGVVAVPAAPDGAAAALVVRFSTVGRYDSWFIRGDANEDGQLDLSDAVRSLEILFLGGESPRCEDSLDINDDGEIDVSDPVSVLLYLFQGGREPAFPGALISGYDLTADTIFCEDR